MSFLDDLENNLKTLEGREEFEGSDQQHRLRDAERRDALAAAPYAERLKSGPYTAELMRQAAVIGYSLRTKVQFTWLGTTLRLEARGRKLELRPTPDGVVTVFFDGNAEVRTVPADLDGSPEELVREFLHAAAI